MTNNPVGWFEIYVQDMPRARRFYESVFSVTLDRLETPVPGVEMWSFTWDEKAYGAPGALVKMEGMPQAGTACWSTSSA